MSFDSLHLLVIIYSFNRFYVAHCPLYVAAGLRLSTFVCNLFEN